MPVRLGGLVHETLDGVDDVGPFVPKSSIASSSRIVEHRSRGRAAIVPPVRFGGARLSVLENGGPHARIRIDHSRGRRRYPPQKIRLNPTRFSGSAPAAVAEPRSIPAIARRAAAQSGRK